MAAREVVYKRTTRRGRTRITTFLPPDHPVVKGVLKAEELLGGRFPEHVGQIRIKSDEVSGRRKGTVVNGRCHFTSRGPAKIEIFAGSIHASAGGVPLEAGEATRAVLHEVGHSRQNKERQEGARLGRPLSIKELETDAERFVVDTYQENHRRVNAGGPPLTMRQILETRKAQPQK